jgi:hypothetical protein
MNWKASGLRASGPDATLAGYAVASDPAQLKRQAPGEKGQAAGSEADATLVADIPLGHFVDERYVRSLPFSTIILRRHPRMLQSPRRGSGVQSLAFVS